MERLAVLIYLIYWATLSIGSDEDVSDSYFEVGQ